MSFRRVTVECPVFHRLEIMLMLRILHTSGMRQLFERLHLTPSRFISLVGVLDGMPSCRDEKEVPRYASCCFVVVLFV